MDISPIFDNPLHAEFACRSWPAEPHQLTRIRSAVRDWLRPLRLTDGAQQDLLLAVNEAATNAVEHAYRPVSEDDVVELVFWTDAHRVWIEIVDHGGWQAPATRPNGRGLGIPLMQRLVDSVLIHFDARGTRVLLGHPLPGRARDLPGEPGRPVPLRVTGQDG
jgi:serine/threonine-protein kinase RsbW